MSVHFYLAKKYKFAAMIYSPVQTINLMISIQEVAWLTTNTNQDKNEFAGRM